MQPEEFQTRGWDLLKTFLMFLNKDEGEVKKKREKALKNVAKSSPKMFSTEKLLDFHRYFDNLLRELRKPIFVDAPDDEIAKIRSKREKIFSKEINEHLKNVHPTSFPRVKHSKKRRPDYLLVAEEPYSAWAYELNHLFVNGTLDFLYICDQCKKLYLAEKRVKTNRFCSKKCSNKWTKSQPETKENNAEYMRKSRANGKYL